MPERNAIICVRLASGLATGLSSGKSRQVIGRAEKLMVSTIVLWQELRPLLVL